MTDDSVTIKKIKPYPIAVSIVHREGAPPVKALILKLTQVGFLMRVKSEYHFKVGDNHSAQFELPVAHAVFNEPIKIIKTYDSLDAGSHKELVKHYTVEAHFRQLSAGKDKEILKFLTAIKQK